jgi:histidinol phosphatase-like PHP family hydrolase
MSARTPTDPGVDVQDFNVAVAGLLYDLVFLHRPKPSALGYKRAARAAFMLDHDLREDLERGTLREVPGIGPATERLIVEFARTGESSIVARAVEQAALSQSAVEELAARRRLRRGFLSRARVNAALAGRAPRGVVSRKDYRGDFQMHSVWSDGSVPIEAMAEGCLHLRQSRICVTDHSYGLPIARGMSMTAVRRQQKEIDALNVKLAGRMRILKGIEANVMADGRVDMAPDELRTFDLVVASPHSLLRKPYDQTPRMLQAVQQRGIHILGHPRGRMLSRPGIIADWGRVFDAAAARRVAVELDGNWYRQDLDVDLAKLALASGCLFAVDSDAHSIIELRDVDFGLAAARLAAIPADRIVNCWDDQRLDDWTRSLRV